MVTADLENIGEVMFWDFQGWVTITLACIRRPFGLDVLFAIAIFPLGQSPQATGISNYMEKPHF